MLGKAEADPPPTPPVFIPYACYFIPLNILNKPSGKQTGGCAAITPRDRYYNLGSSMMQSSTTKSNPLTLSLLRRRERDGEDGKCSSSWYLSL